jgi:hypothetical protein
MDKILNRKLFKDRYLQSVSKNIAHFKKGGLASLRAKHFFLGGESTFTPGERQAAILAPIASALLTGTRRPGQSQLGAVASNIGAGIPGAINTAVELAKVEKEGKAGVTVNTGEKETTEQKEYGKLYAKKATDILEQGTSAGKEQNTLSIMRQATNQADLKTGSFGEFRTGMEKVGQEFGLNLNLQNTPAAEVLQSYSGELVLNKLDKFKGSISDGERKFVVERTPGLTTSKEGINTILDIKERANELAKQFAIETEQWIIRNEGISKKDKQTGMTFSEFENEFQKKYPLLTDELKAKINNASNIIDPQFGSNVRELDGKRYIRINNKTYEVK